MTQKKAEALFKKKARLRHFTDDLLKRSLVNHAEALYPYFSSLISLSGICIRNSDQTVSKFGEKFCILLYTVFTSQNHRQQVLEAIITHIGSGIVRIVRIYLTFLET